VGRDPECTRPPALLSRKEALQAERNNSPHRARGSLLTRTPDASSAADGDRRAPPGPRRLPVSWTELRRQHDCACMDIAHAQKLCEPTGRQPVRVALGLKMLGFCLIKNALEDFCGRMMDTQDPAIVRKRAATAARWLRRGGKDGRTAAPFTLDWGCPNLLATDPRTIAMHGVHCLPNSGLAYWRSIRAQRLQGHVPTQQRRRNRTLRHCDFCNFEYVSSHARQQYCSQRCARRALLAQQMRFKPVQQSTLRTTSSWSCPGYQGLAGYCRDLSLPLVPGWLYLALNYA